MTFSRVNSGGWALYEMLSSAQMNALDINMTRALDGYSGGDYSPSSALKVHGKIVGESVVSRVFLYPIECGVAQQGAKVWLFDQDFGWWISEAVATPIQMAFGLNRFVPQGAKLLRIRARVSEGAAEATKWDRISCALYRSPANNYTYDDIIGGYFPQNATGIDWLDFSGGTQDGGDGKAILTDSARIWVNDELIGYTVYNLTDGSSGVITDNDGTTVTATLAGGANNHWDDDDVYWIDKPIVEDFDSAAYRYSLIFSKEAGSSSSGIHQIEITYVEGDYLAVP